MSRILVSSLVSITLAGCASYQLTPEEKSYLDRVRKASLIFTVANDTAPQARERAEEFVTRHALNGPGVISGTVIESNPPSRERRGYGYRITFAPAGKNTVVEVYTWHGLGSASIRQMRRNARILAHFIQTGEIHPRLLDESAAFKPASTEERRRRLE